MRFVLAAILSAAVTGAGTAAPIVIDTATFGGHTYYLLSTSNWTDAQAKAVTLGGNLVTVNGAAENDFLYNRFGSVDGESRRGLWIGFNDAAVEGTFVWVNGEPVTYTNWEGGEPNNNGDEDYAYLRPFSGGLWNDLANDGPYDGEKFGVVEVPTAPTPEPVSCVVFGGLLAAGGLAARRRMKATA